MKVMTPDARTVTEAPAPRLAGGLLLALVSATSFGTSGTLASGLLETGWSAGAAVLVRIAVAAVVVLPFGVYALRGRWRLLRSNAGLVATYGVAAVAGAQLCYFLAVSRMQVATALMIEYAAPAVVVGWLWLRHGQRPGPVTLVGAGLSTVGLVIVLDLTSGAGVDPVGVLWALGAMAGVATYFVISADEDNGLPPMALAAGGLVVGAALLGLAALVGLLPMTASTADTAYAGREVPWWLPVAGLGLVSAAMAYTSGIAASRRLGSRLASFVGLLEVVAAVGFAWLLLDELPSVVQLAGGGLILAGVVVVRLGERAGTPGPMSDRSPAGPASAPAAS
jgi:drug/metabolite transporter (DMT)-like permease